MPNSETQSIAESREYRLADPLTRIVCQHNSLSFSRAPKKCEGRKENRIWKDPVRCV